MERQQRATRPPIELVAARLRDARRQVKLLAAMPDLMDGRDVEIRRVVTMHDEHLIIAAEMVGVDLEGVSTENDTLCDADRRHVERLLGRSGWQLH